MTNEFNDMYQFIKEDKKLLGSRIEEQLIEYIRKKILEDYNVTLIPEVLVLGEE